MRNKIIIGIIILVIIAVLIAVGLYFCPCKDKTCLIIDSFEGEIIGGEDATVDYGSGSGAWVEVKGVDTPVKDGKQALEIFYDVSNGGYMWIARGYDLTAKNAGQWKLNPNKIKWNDYDAFSFYLYGENSGNDIAVDLIDNGKEYFRFIIKDTSNEWKEVFIPFVGFKARTDWQPDSAIKNNKLDFPVKAFQFEPKTGTGTIVIDKIYLKKKQEKEEN